MLSYVYDDTILEANAIMLILTVGFAVRIIVRSHITFELNDDFIFDHQFDYVQFCDLLGLYLVLDKARFARAVADISGLFSLQEKGALLR